jgi:HAE1 family hydrophobic/amphiphilic exporter-1
VILIGTVVNNAILIVHQSLHYIREGMSPRAAVPESVKTRIRPIFITTNTTVLGLLPLVVFPGAGSELYRGIGSVVLGGLIFSTMFTLFLVPAVFILMMDLKESLARVLFRQPQIAVADGPAVNPAMPNEPAFRRESPIAPRS